MFEKMQSKNQIFMCSFSLKFVLKHTHIIITLFFGTKGTCMKYLYIYNLLNSAYNYLLLNFTIVEEYY